MSSGSPRSPRGAPRPGDGPGAPLHVPDRLVRERLARGGFAGAVFDFDGLLVDSEPLWADAERELLARHGDQLTPADAAATHGRSIDDTIDGYAVRLRLTDVDALRAELMALMAERYRSQARLRPGATDLVRLLGDTMPLAVASNTDGPLVRAVLDACGIGTAFSAVVSGLDVARGKPWPDLYLAACRAIGVAASDALAFEDSPPGVRSAKAAGLFCVGVPDRPGIDLVAAGADLVVDSLEAFRSMLDIQG